jgi:hypothetical protein
MRRLFWLAMGVTIGALVVRKLTRAAERLTPRGVAQGLGGGLAELSESVKDFTVQVREAMREREAELREGTAMDGTLGRNQS